jgi:hypothetical protein
MLKCNLERGLSVQWYTLLQGDLAYFASPTSLPWTFLMILLLFNMGIGMRNFSNLRPKDSHCHKLMGTYPQPWIGGPQ